MAVKRAEHKGLTILALFLSFLSMVLLVLILFMPVSRRDRLAMHLDRADTLISQEAWNAAGNSLSAASRHSHEKRHWYRILKRALIVSEATGDYRLFARLAGKAVRDIPGNEDLWAFRIAGLMWSGQVRKAAAETRHLKSQEYLNLKAEVLLRFENEKLLARGEEPDSGMTALRNELEVSTDPLYFEHIGRMGNKPELLFNAALLWMRMGQTEKVSDLLPLLVGEKVPLKGTGLLAYDTENYPLAIDRLLTQSEKEGQSETPPDWEVLQLIADSHFQIFNRSGQNRNAEKAASFYTRASRLVDERRWISLLNLSLLNNRTGQLKSSWQIAQSLLEEHAGEKEVVLFFTEYFHKEYPVIMERLIFDYLKVHPTDSEIRFLALRYLGGHYSPEQYKAELWDMYNHNGGSVSIARYLLWYLLGSEQLEESAILVERILHSSGDPQWLSAYRAVLVAKRGDVISADEIFSQVQDPDALVLYNRAILAFTKKDWASSIEFLDKAEKRILEGSFPQNALQANALRSRLHVLRGFIALDQGETAEALFELEMALTLDQDSPIASQLKSALSKLL